MRSCSFHRVIGRLLLVGVLGMWICLAQTPAETSAVGDWSPQEQAEEAARSVPVARSSARVFIQPGPALPSPRGRHTATALPNGKVLLVGGQPAPNESLADVHLFDSATGSITPVAPLHTPRHDHSATLLRDGRVLVVGGYTLPQHWLADAEVYAPAADTWTVVPPLYAHGTAHTATLMKDGRVLVVGGGIGDGVASERVEIFNPRTNSWTEAMPLEADRVDHTAVLLDDGRVLVAGGGNARGISVGGDALVYDPKTNRWTPTGPMVMPRMFAESVRLIGGRVLVAGGAAANGAPILQILASAEIYNPASNTWIAAAPLANARYGYSLTRFANGQVLAIGGARDWDSIWSEQSFISEIEVYNPIADRWHTAGELPRPGASAAAALLRGGRGLWVTGGQAGRSGTTFWQDTWLIAPKPWIHEKECEHPDDSTIALPVVIV